MLTIMKDVPADGIARVYSQSTRVNVSLKRECAHVCQWGDYQCCLCAKHDRPCRLCQP